MWIILVSLLLVPVAVGIVILGRVLGGNPTLTDKEARLFGDSEDTSLSFWMWLKFGVLVVLFFVLGIIEGVVLINLGSLWMVLAPLITGIGAMLILLQWLTADRGGRGGVARLYRVLVDLEEEPETHDRKIRTALHPAHASETASFRGRIRARSQGKKTTRRWG